MSTRISKKKCWDCGKIKPLSQFYVNRAIKSGRASDCSECNRKSRRKYWLKNKDKMYAKNAEYRRKNRRKIKSMKLMYSYSLTIDQLEGLLKRQNYKCAIGKETINIESANVDHCHTTGKVRGLLCGNCNKGIGFLRDSIKNLKQAIKYLEN